LSDTSFCNNASIFKKELTISSIVKADFKTPIAGCAPYGATFSNTSIATGGTSFQWDFGDGNTSTARTPVHTYTTPGTYTIRLTVTDPNTCNVTDTKEFSIVVYGKPTSVFTHSTPVVNTPVTFNNNSSPDAVRFKWEFGDGDSLVTTSRNPIQHEYNKTDKYNACLTAYNQQVVPDRVCQQIDIQVETALDVPNAFTPTLEM
jgi:PKD repeat protein